METPVNRRRLSDIPNAELRSVPDAGICQRYYKCNGENLTELMTMCFGLKSVDGADRYLGDVLVEPYLSMKFKKKVTPTQKHMVEEVKRRSKCNESPSDGPSCNYWTKERLQNWLCDNPVSEADDITFLVAEEQKLHDTVSKAKKTATPGMMDLEGLHPGLPMNRTFGCTIASLQKRPVMH
jgi:hypothetical protein